MAFLAKPDEKYKESYLQNLVELQKEEGPSIVALVQRLSANFAEYVQLLRDSGEVEHFQAEGGPQKLARLNGGKEYPEQGRLPEHYFWLVEGTEYIGTLRLRPVLSPRMLHFSGHIGYFIRPSRRKQGYGVEILKLGLEKAREAGLSRVLLCCDTDNTGSKKIIEANGGKFDTEVEYQQSGVTNRGLRYWIEL